MHGQYCFLDREFLLKHVRQSIAANILPPYQSQGYMRERRESKDYARLDMPLAIPAQILALLCGTLGLSIPYQPSTSWIIQYYEIGYLMYGWNGCQLFHQTPALLCLLPGHGVEDRQASSVCLWAHRETLANTHPGAKSLSGLR